MTRHRILVSACLLGQPVRYNGLDKKTDDHHLQRWVKEGSPSCGSSYSYDGSFTGGRVPVPGVTAARLIVTGIRVFSEHELAAADAYLRALDEAAAD
jgi:uncharacterized protein YbbK (DUF523 family)